MIKVNASPSIPSDRFVHKNPLFPNRVNNRCYFMSGLLKLYDNTEREYAVKSEVLKMFLEEKSL